MRESYRLSLIGNKEEHFDQHLWMIYPNVLIAIVKKENEMHIRNQLSPTYSVFHYCNTSRITVNFSVPDVYLRSITLNSINPQ